MHKSFHQSAKNTDEELKKKKNQNMQVQCFLRYTQTQRHTMNVLL